MMATLSVGVVNNTAPAEAIQVSEHCSTYDEPNSPPTVNTCFLYDPTDLTCNVGKAPKVYVFAKLIPLFYADVNLIVNNRHVLIDLEGAPNAENYSNNHKLAPVEDNWTRVAVVRGTVRHSLGYWGQFSIVGNSGNWTGNIWILVREICVNAPL